MYISPSHGVSHGLEVLDHKKIHTTALVARDYNIDNIENIIQITSY